MNHLWPNYHFHKVYVVSFVVSWKKIFEHVPIEIYILQWGTFLFLEDQQIEGYRLVVARYNHSLSTSIWHLQASCLETGRIPKIKSIQTFLCVKDRSNRTWLVIKLCVYGQKQQWRHNTMPLFIYCWYRQQKWWQ